MVAEKFGALGSELGEAGDGVAGVVGVVVFGAIPGVLKDGLARGTVGEGGEERLLRGVLEGDCVAFDLAIFG